MPTKPTNNEIKKAILKKQKLANVSFKLSK